MFLGIWLKAECYSFIDIWTSLQEYELAAVIISSNVELWFSV